MRHSWTIPRWPVIALRLAGLLLVMGGCVTTVTIKTLRDDARRFEGENVRIVGDVESPVGTPGLRAYQMNDGTGTLRVIGESAGCPRVGARVGVEGTFRSAFSIGDEALAVLVERGRFAP